MNQEVLEAGSGEVPFQFYFSCKFVIIPEYFSFFLCPMITIHTFIFSPFSENTYVLYDETKECIIIDPGCYEQSEKLELVDFISKNKLKPVRLLNTHCHIDHVFGNKFVADTFGLKPEAHKEELFNLKHSEAVSQMYGLSGYENSPLPSIFLSEADVIEFGNSELEILFVPGHAPGHIAFASKAQKFVISGDVLFYGSIGRTDFPGCSHEDLIKSIKTKLFPLGDDFRVFSGHGPQTNIGFERKNNPFLQV